MNSDGTSHQHTCTQCGRRFSAVMMECPFCGMGRQAGQGGNGAPVPSAASMVQPPPPEAPALAGPATLHEYAATMCASCGMAAPLLRLRMQTWEDMGFSFTGKHKYRVVQRDVPCFCKACTAAHHRKVFIADLLAVLPSPLLACLAVSSGNGTVPAVLGLLYAGYLLRWGFYCWADMLVYGGDLGQVAARWTARDAGRVRFPCGWLHGMLRCALFMVLGFLGLVIGELCR